MLGLNGWGGLLCLISVTEELALTVAEIICLMKVYSKGYQGNSACAHAYFV